MLRFCITLATILCLAFAAQSTLSVLLTFDQPDPDGVEIEFLEKQSLASQNLESRLAVKALLADGRALRPNSTDYTASWQPAEAPMSMPSSLLYKKSAEPAVLTFRALRFVAVLEPSQWSGVIRVKRNGTTVQVVDIQHQEERQPHRIAVEDPAVPSSPALFAGTFVLLAGCAWWFGPIRAGRKGLPWLVFFLSTLHLLFWAGQCIGTQPDSIGYLDTVPLIAKGTPSYFPPGYPALLGLIGTLGETLGACTTLTQHAMTVLTAVWLYILLSRIVFDGLALLGGVLAGALAPSLIVSQTVLSETATSFAMVGALYYTIRSVDTGKTQFTILAGVLTGWATTLRLVPLAALLPAICTVHLFSPARNRFQRIAMTVAAMGAILLLPTSWYWYKSGHPSLANSVGLHLYNRVIHGQKLVDEKGSATRALFTLLDGQDPRDLPAWEVWAHRGLQEVPYDEFELLLRRVALEGIYEQFWEFVTYTPYLAWRLFVTPTDTFPAWGDTIDVNSRLEDPPLVPLTAISLDWRWTVEEISRLLWPILCWGAIAGTFLGLLGQQRPLIAALAWVPLSYLLLTASTEQFSERYNAPIVPLVVALAMYPLDLIRTKSIENLGVRLIFHRGAPEEPVVSNVAYMGRDRGQPKVM